MTLNEFADRTVSDDIEVSLTLNVANIINDMSEILRSAVYVNENGMEALVEVIESPLQNALYSLVQLIKASGYDIEDMAYNLTQE